MHGARQVIKRTELLFSATHRALDDYKFELERREGASSIEQLVVAPQAGSSRTEVTSGLVLRVIVADDIVGCAADGAESVDASGVVHTEWAWVFPCAVTDEFLLLDVLRVVEALEDRSPEVCWSRRALALAVTF